MGRHTEEIDVSAIRSPGSSRLGRLAMIGAGVVSLIGVAALVTPAGAAIPGLPALPFTGPGCEPVAVHLTVTPELRDLVTQMLADSEDYEAPECIDPVVTAEEPERTAASAGVLPEDRAPQIWIPDDGSWTVGAAAWRTRSSGSLASSPVVMATSDAAAKSLGWDGRNPTWEQVMRGRRAVSVADYRAEAESLDALIALWNTMGRKAKADQAIVATVLAADRQEVPPPQRALANARAGSRNAPLIPTTEQNVIVQNREAAAPHVVAVYPREGSPRLNYPILAIPGAAVGAEQQAAVTTVIDRMTSPAVQDMVTAAGFRNLQGSRPSGEGIRSEYGLELKRPADDVVQGMIDRLDRLSKPTRTLAVLDVSLSMQATLDDGLSRIGVGMAAARLGANLLADSGSVGAWLFAADMPGGKDYQVLAPLRRLDSTTEQGESWRSYLSKLASGDPNRYLRGGGTALYDTTDAAYAWMHENYDPDASNALILLSDGANEDSDSISLQELVKKLKKANSGDRKVAIFAAGLGPDADYDALRKIAEATGGHSYRIDSAGEGQEALLDGLRRSRRISD